MSLRNTVLRIAYPLSTLPPVVDGTLPLILLLLAGLLWYVAAHGGAVQAGTHHVWRSGVAHALPVLGFAVWAGLRGQPLAGAAVVVSYAVAALSLVQGVAFASSGPDVRSQNPTLRRGDALIIGPIAAVFAVLLAGQLSWEHVPLVLLPALATAWALAAKTNDAKQWWWVVVATVPAAVGGYVATSAAKLDAQAAQSLLGSALFAPMIALPMIGTAVQRAQDGHTDHAVAVIHRAVLVALGLGLPIAITASLGQLGTIQRLWRVDGLLLLVLGGLSVVRGFSGFKPGRATGYLLVAGYVVYLATIALRLRG